MIVLATHIWLWWINNDYQHWGSARQEQIAGALARIKLGLQECPCLGNMNSLRDWGHAKDYVEMQWMMLRQDKPEDFVIATGMQYSVRDFVNAAAKELGYLDPQSSGLGPQLQR